MKRNIAKSASSKSELQRRYGSEVDLEQLTGKSRRTWQKYRLFNRGPRWYKIGGNVLYDLDEVLAWLKSKAAGGEVA